MQTLNTKMFSSLETFIRYGSKVFLKANRVSNYCNTVHFTTAGDWDCVAAVERLPALHYSVDFIFLSFGTMGIIVEL